MLDYENLGYADSANGNRKRYPDNDKYMKGYYEQLEYEDVLKSGDNVSINLNGTTERFKFNYRDVGGTPYIFLSVCNGTISLLNIKHIIAKGFKGNPYSHTIKVYKKAGFPYMDYLRFLIDNHIVEKDIVEENDYVFELKLTEPYWLKG